MKNVSSMVRFLGIFQTPKRPASVPLFRYLRQYPAFFVSVLLLPKKELITASMSLWTTATTSAEEGHLNLVIKGSQWLQHILWLIQGHRFDIRSESYKPFLLYSSPSSFGDHVFHFNHQWQSIILERWFLEISSYLIQFKFLSPPNPLSHQSCQGSSSKELANWQDSFSSRVRSNGGGTSQEQREGVSFVLLYFLILKKMGAFIKQFHFLMLSLASVITSLLLQDWFTALDSKDAYFRISILPCHKKYLCSVVKEDHFQYRVLPFGLSTTLRVFTKCLLVVATYLRKQGIFV